MRRLAALALALPLAAGALADPTPAAAAPKTAGTPAFVPVRVVLDAAPQSPRLRGARVTVRAAGSGRVLGRDVTGELGVSLADLRLAKAPRRFVVQVRGGTVAGRPLRGVLRTEVRGYRPGSTVVVDLATTLAAAHRAANPGTSVAAAEIHAEQRLGIPAEHDLGAAVVGPAHLDGSAALEALHADGVGGWTDARLAGTAATRAGLRAGPGTLSSPSLLAGLATIGIGAFEIANVGLVVYSVYEILFAGSDGGATETLRELDRIESELASLGTAIATLTTQVTALGYSNGANALQGTIANVTSAYTTYSTLLQARQQQNGDANSIAQSVIATYGDQVVDGKPLRALGQLTPATLPGVVANAPSTSFVGAVRAAGLTTTAPAIQIATVAGANPGAAADPGSGTPGPAPGANGLVAQASQASTANLRWFTARDAAVARAVWRYYADAFSAAAKITSTYQMLTTASGLTTPVQGKVRCGETSSSRDVTVRAQFANLAQLDCYRTALQSLQPTTFPEGAVLDLTTYTMWSTQIGARLSQGTWQAMDGQPATLTPAGVQGAAGTLPPGSTANTTLLGAAPKTPTLPDGRALADWRVAGSTQLKGLFASSVTGDTLVNAAGFDANLLWPAGNGTRVFWTKDNNSYWGPFGYSTAIKTGNGCATTGFSCGFSTSQYVPLLGIESCSKPCMSPSYAAGGTMGLWDLSAGIDLYTDPTTAEINSINGTGLQALRRLPAPARTPVSSPGGSHSYNWSSLYNWNGDFQSCDAFIAIGDSACREDSNRRYPGIGPTLDRQGLPSLFYRVPGAAVAGTPQNECYFWPAGAGSAPPPGQVPAPQPSGTTNGCPGA